MRCLAIAVLASGCQSLFGLDDSKPRDGGDGRCYGTGIEVCFDAPLLDPVALTSAIDTGTETGEGASAACVPYTGHDEGLFCVVAGTTVSIDASAKISVSGSRPLVVVADQTLQIDGVLDAAAHVSPVRRPGPAADVAICPACLSNPARTGGGTGGSCGEGGATGGAGDNDAGGGLCPLPDTTAFRAGCAGQNGGTSNGMTGLGGGGGGALYLLAGTSITITGTGTVDVSGAGGVEGRCEPCTGDTTGVAFGAGGGGSGGMLVFESPDIEVIGHVYADGGGGGEGGSHSTYGLPGADPDGTGPALGGNSTNPMFHGGGGGNGGHLGSGPVIGMDGTSSAPGGGGGGGGGVGVIRVIGTLTGTTSPAPL